MTYYLKYDADAIARSCSGYAQEVAGSIRLTTRAGGARRTARRSRASSPGGRFFEEIEAGQQRLAVYVMAPAGEQPMELSLDSRPFNPVVTQDYDGRPVAQVVTVLDPGETQEIEFEFRTGPGQTVRSSWTSRRERSWLGSAALPGAPADAGVPISGRASRSMGWTVGSRANRP